MPESTHNDTNHLSDDICVDLLLEQLPAADARHALRHLEVCAECENRFQELAGQWELAAVRAKRLASSASVTDAVRTSAWRAINDRFRMKRWLVPAAAAAVILLMLVIPRPGDESRQPPLVKLPTLSETVQPRAALPPSMNKALHEGIDAYVRDDFDAAVEALSRVDTDGALDAFRRIYLANALAWSGRHAEVSDVLADVPFEFVPEPWASEAQWTLYVALAETGETVRAEALLSELKKIDGPVGDRARAITEE